MEMETENRKRSMDKRRETSRCAARERRGKESEVFDDLKEVVPLVDDGTVGHLDRIALLRVAATVCRFRCQAANVLDNLVIPDIVSRKQNLWTEDTMTECLDGFVIMSDSDGNVFYITESVAFYLGLTQTDIAGRSLKEFLHLDDYNEFRDIVAQLVIRNSEETQGRTVVLRMKTVISPRGRNLNMKSALFKPVSFVIRSKKADVGHVVFMQGVCVPAGQGSVNANATALTKGSDTPSGTYMTRHTCDMRISFISERFNYILKSDLKSLVGASYYDLVHPGDIELIAKSMKELFTKGHVRTPYYRLVAANGNFAWLMTDANTTQHTCKGQRGQYVVCVHYIIGIQEPSESLVVCTDTAPAGLPVEVKKEIDDLREYVGRQPEVIDADNFVPLFADDNYCVTETLRPQENGAPPEGVDAVFWQCVWPSLGYKIPPDRVEKRKDDSMETELYEYTGTEESCQFTFVCMSYVSVSVVSYLSPASASRSDSYDEVLEWLYDGQPPSPRARAGECRQSSDPTLASAQLMAQAPRSSYGSAYPYRTEVCRGSEGPYSERSGAIHSRSQEYQGAGAREAYMFNGGRSLPSSTATNTPPSLSAVHSPDHNSLPSCEHGSDPTLFSPMLAANPSTGQVSAMPDLSTTIVEDLQWEEPDLTGLAPFVPDDDVIDFGAESLPKDLEMLFSDMPQWRPAQPMVARGNPTDQRVKYEPAMANYDYQGRDAIHTDYQSQSSQQQYWQQQNWAASNNYTY